MRASLSGLASLLLVFATALLGCSGGGSSGPPDSGPLPVDQCQGTTDKETMAAVLPDGGVDGGTFQGVFGILEDCGRGPCLDAILNDDDPVGCMNACFDATAAAPLSSGCRGCFFEAMACGQEHCVVACFSSDPSACPTCLEANCYSRLFECMGP